MVSPLGTGSCGGTTNTALGVGRTGLLVSAHHRLELVEIGEVAVDGCELDRGNRIHAREAALGEGAHLLGRGLAAQAAALGNDRVGDRVELVLGHGPPAGGSTQAPPQLLAVELLPRATP